MTDGDGNEKSSPDDLIEGPVAADLGGSIEVAVGGGAADLPPMGGGGPIWTEERFNEWRSYSNSSDVVVRFDRMGSWESGPGYYFITPEVEPEWPREWVERCLLEIASADAENSCCGEGNFLLDSYENRMSWGASGASYQVILTLAEGMAVAATYEGLRWVAGRMAAKAKEAWSDIPFTDLDEESAILAAKYAVNLRLIDGAGDRPGELEVISTRVDAGQATIELRGQGGQKEYEVVVERVGGIINLGRVRTVRTVTARAKDPPL